MKRLQRLLAIALSVITVLSLFAFTSCKGKSKVDLQKYVTITSEGVNGKGYIRTDTNVPSELNLIEEYKISEAQAYTLRKLLTNLEISYDDSLNDKFSNGDKIHIKLLFLPSEADETGCEFVNNEFEYTVDGLVVPIDCDPFKDLKVTFSGENGSGKVELDDSKIEEKTKSAVIFNVYNSDGEIIENALYGGLSNGDKITIEVEESDYVNFLQTKKEYTVSGLKAPVTVNNIEKVDRTEINKEFEHEIKYKYEGESESYCDFYKNGKIIENITAKSQVFTMKSFEPLGAYYGYHKKYTNIYEYSVIYKITGDLDIEGEKYSDVSAYIKCSVENPTEINNVMTTDGVDSSKYWNESDDSNVYEKFKKESFNYVLYDEKYRQSDIKY